MCTFPYNISQNLTDYCRVQRKSVLQPAIWASYSQHVLAHKSFQLAPKPFLISRIDYNPSVIWISQKNSTCPSGKLRTKITSPIAKSTSSGLLDTTFFARCYCVFGKHPVRMSIKSRLLRKQSGCPSNHAFWASNEQWKLFNSFALP